MIAAWIEALIGSFESKKQYKQHMARIDALPEPYGSAAKAFHRYFLLFGGHTDGDVLNRMIGDHADLWERAAVDGTPVRAVVGDDPVEFAETFAQSYVGRRWMDQERERLTRAVDTAAGEERPSA